DACIDDEEALLHPRLANAGVRAVEELPVERGCDGPAEAQARGGDRTELRHRAGELVAGHADAVAGPAAVDGDEDDIAVAELADRRPRLPRVQVRRREELARREDGLAALDEQRAAAQGRHDRPPRLRER